MVAFAEPSRPTRRAPARQCEGSAPCAPGKNPTLRTDRNQQYSINALTDASGTIVERYAYTAYGQPAFFDGSGTAITSSAENNRYTYTGREWDEDLHLDHYRARMYDAVSGRFLGRDPIGYMAGPGLFQFMLSHPTTGVDLPSGLETIDVCKCASLPAHWFGCCKASPTAKKAEKYRTQDECCEDGRVVTKVEISICVGKLGGDGSWLPNISYLSHTYIICPDGKMYGKHSNPSGAGYWWDFGWGPGYIRTETDRDPSKAKCRTKKVCPKTAERMCREGYPDDSYNVFCIPLVGDNCHAWGSGNSQLRPLSQASH